MTSKLVVNTIEADTGISSVSFASSISMDSTSKFHFSAAGVDIGADTNINRPAAGVLGFNISGVEKVRIDTNGHLNTSGIVTAANFKTGVTNLHSTGLTLTGGQLDVGSNIKVGTAGVITATSFVGSGAQLTGITGTTINNNANNRIITGSGTANTLEGESGLTYDGSTLQVNGDGQFTGNDGTAEYIWEISPFNKTWSSSDLQDADSIVEVEPTHTFTSIIDGGAAVLAGSTDGNVYSFKLVSNVFVNQGQTKIPFEQVHSLAASEGIIFLGKPLPNTLALTPTTVPVLNIVLIPHLE